MKRNRRRKGRRRQGRGGRGGGVRRKEIGERGRRGGVRGNCWGGRVEGRRREISHGVESSERRGGTGRGRVVKGFICGRGERVGVRESWGASRGGA